MREKDKDTLWLPNGFGWVGRSVVLTGFARRIREELDPKTLPPLVLARVYAAVDNELGMLIGEADEGPWAPADEENFQETEELAELLRKEIFTRLREQDARTFARLQEQAEGYRSLTEPFLEQYGLLDGSGWWGETEREENSQSKT